MKGPLKLLIVSLGLLQALAVPAAEFKIGAVSIGKILNDAPQAQQANARLKKEFEPREKSLVDAQKSLRGMEQKLERDGAVMSDGQRRNLERDIRTQARELQRAQEEFRDDLNLRRNEELGKFQKQVLDVVNNVAKEEGFDLVINDQATLYVSQRVDVTDKVLSRLTAAK